MLNTSKDKCPSNAAKKNRAEVKDEHGAGRPFPRSLQKIEAVHDVILKDQRIGVERTADTLNVSYLFDVIHRHLVRKNCVKWVCKCPNADQR
jgi:hypothetical protein